MAKGKKKKEEAKADSGDSTSQQSCDPDYAANKLSADALIAKMLKNFQADAIPDTIRENLLRCVQEAQASGLDASLFAGLSDLANSSDSSGANETKDSYMVPGGSFAEMHDVLQYPGGQYSHADNRSIHVGWLTSVADANTSNVDQTDIDIAGVCKTYGTYGYNFICYPIGGMKRSFWTPINDTKPPRIHLPDIQLQSQLWQTYVNCTVSSWVDPDHETEFIAKLSEEALEEELEYCTYMGLRSVVIELKHARSPRLAAIVKRWLWEKCTRFTFWIMVRTNAEFYSKDEELDVWAIWADFRSACENFTSAKIVVGFIVTGDLGDEFVVPDLYNRWKGEPLSVFWLDSDVFLRDPSTSEICLSPAHATLLSDLWYSSCQRVLISSLSKNLATPHLVPALARAVRSVIGPRMVAVEENSSMFSPGRPNADPTIADYIDTLQSPLQPLSDTLDSTVYETFEQDAVKYIQYRKAMSKALADIFDRNTSIHERPLVIMILGAGRGPLVTAALEAFDLLQKTVPGASRIKVDVYAVEKNKCACVTLNYCNNTRWKGVVKVINGDMRELGDLHKKGEIKSPDLMVSELIGSFGDNELSPECLDGVTPIIRKDTISIPQSYRSYVAPIHSVRLQQSVVQLTPDYWTTRVPQKGRNPKVHGIPTDRVYVVCLRGFHPLGEPQLCFEFHHPNFEGKSNARSQRLTFRFSKNCEVMGFAGYFDATLYGDIKLGTVPGHETRSLVSWFPALIPLREAIRVRQDMEATFCLARKVDETGTWYEWNVEYKNPTTGEPMKTVVQNENAFSDYMKLYTAFDAMLYMLLP